MAISTLAYKITADTSSLTSGVQATRRELNLAKRVMQETEDPAERLERALAGVEAIHKKGLISAQQFAKAQDQVRRELSAGIPTAELVPPAVNKIGGAFTSATAALTKFAGPLGVTLGGFVSLQSALAGITDQLEAIDDLGDRAQKFGIDVNTLRTFEVAAQRAGISADSLESALEKMVKQIGDAQRLGGAPAKIFETLGLDIDRLSRLTPELQFVAVAEQVRKLDSDAAKLSATMQVFGRGSGDLVRLLDLGAAGFAKTRAEVERLLGTIDPAKIQQFQEDLETLGLVREGFFGGLAEGVAGGEVGQAAGLARRP